MPGFFPQFLTSMTCRHAQASRLPEGAGDHEVDCKTDLGAFMLKAEFLKKA